MTRNPWPIVAAVAVAGGVGFGLARFTVPSAPPPPATESKAEPAKTELKIDPARLTAAGIAVEAVSIGAVGGEIAAPATVKADPTGEAVLAARAPGTVSRILKRLGDPVRAGETVAVVESRDASAIAADRGAAAAKAVLAQRRLAREKSLFEQKVSPRQDYETAEAEAAFAAAEVRRADAAAAAARVAGDGRSVLVSSPISGRVSAMTASLGAFVQADAELFRVADPRRIQVEALVSGPDAVRIAPGDRAVVELPDGGTVPATVRAVAPGLDADSRSATVVLTLTGEAPGLQPGQVARARITARPPVGGTGPAGGIRVPEEAVQMIQGRDAVFLQTPTGFKVRNVTVGQRLGGRADIISGLPAGDRIAARNAFLLKAELNKGAEEEE